MGRRYVYIDDLDALVGLMVAQVVEDRDQVLGVEIAKLVCGARAEVHGWYSFRSVPAGDRALEDSIDRVGAVGDTHVETSSDAGSFAIASR